MASTVPIPEPPAYPLLGNILRVDRHHPLTSVTQMADQLGEIFRLRSPVSTIVFVSSNALISELCNETRFRKSVNAILQEIRHALNDGLFTAKAEESNWALSHRILARALGPLMIADMFDQMHDLASQLVLKWARHGTVQSIDVVDDFTRLSFDTVALCTMNHRFNSSYSYGRHPCISATQSFLEGATQRAYQPPFLKHFFSNNRVFFSSIKFLRQTIRDIINTRTKADFTRRDALWSMLNEVDPVTGQRMSSESIVDNLLTFLIAGHETTAALLSFTFWELCRNPEVLKKAQREVDNTCGGNPIGREHLNKLPYVAAVLREILRLHPPASAFSVEALQNEVVGGKYHITKGEIIVNLVSKAHRDQHIFGHNSHDFVPDRMVDGHFQRLSEEFPNFWKPFGNGVRRCLGEPFAWQEAMLVTSMILQKFHCALEDGCEPEIDEQLVIKPRNLRITVQPRERQTPVSHSTSSSAISHAGMQNQTEEVSDTDNSCGKKTPITILYGFNNGTCKTLAQVLATNAPSNGFEATTVTHLDSMKGHLPTNHPIIIIIGTYDGQPPEDAKQFVSWIEGVSSFQERFREVSYAVFGCGHRDWRRTHFRIPQHIDSKLKEFGAFRVVPIGLGETSQGDLATLFDEWQHGQLWPALMARWNGTVEVLNETHPKLRVSVQQPRLRKTSEDFANARVLRVRKLTDQDALCRPKFHVEIALPKVMTYKVGDYLSILPMNARTNVQRAMRQFCLPRDAYLSLDTTQITNLLPHACISAVELLSGHVELAQSASHRALLVLANAATDQRSKDELVHQADEAGETSNLVKKPSVLDLLEQYPSIDLSIEDFLPLLPPMRPRYYSISSSPRWQASHLTITVSAITAPSKSGHEDYVGLCSSYLCSLSCEDIIQVAVKPTNSLFRLPQDSSQRGPLICVAVGTGIAPFRGLFQDRSYAMRGRESVASALFFYGCHSPSWDDLYKEELQKWEDAGVVVIKKAYSKNSDKSEGCRYVQERIWQCREMVASLWKQGARVYVCGPKQIAIPVRTVLFKIQPSLHSSTKEKASHIEAEQWFDSMKGSRYQEETFK